MIVLYNNKLEVGAQVVHVILIVLYNTKLKVGAQEVHVILLQQQAKSRSAGSTRYTITS